MRDRQGDPIARTGHKKASTYLAVSWFPTRGVRGLASCLSAEPILDHFTHRHILLDQHAIEALPPGRDPGRAGAGERIKDASAPRANETANILD